MNIDGSRPRLTDLDADGGLRANDGAIDVPPEPSPDGAMLASYRHLTETPGPFGDWDV